ncbi:guanylate-binding protein 5-like [Montipora capricornis]|uniref:guanylate-binding protein 5-like n=1 Tax=Montipora capricornis TaxID=246305 RepID=UPI0035F1355F
MTCQKLCFRGLIVAYSKANFLSMHCKMKLLASRFLIAMSIAIYFASNAQGEPARLLLKFNKTGKTFELNPTALVELSHLQRPVRVIAVVGDARIGKSTTMNLISHIWTKASRNKVEEIFETGDTFDTVTHDVWCHIIQDERGGNVVLLDVEGTNLGDDALTIQLSMFTALISSGLNVFVREMFQNNNLHFLFHMSRRSDLVFPNISMQYFPKLQVVIRGALSGPGGRTIEDYTRDAIVEPSFQESMQEERKTIAKHFPRNQITVSQIPLVSRELFKDFEKLRESDYWTKMEQLAGKFKEFPVKKTLRGSPIDGRGLVELAVSLAETMNADSWPDFANVYDAVERNICKRSHVKLIEPLFELMKAHEIKEKSGDALEAFKMECELEDEIAAAREDLRHIAEERRNAEELELEAKKAENERIAAEKRHKEQEKKYKHKLSIKDDQIAEVKREKEEAETKERNLIQLYKEQLKTIALLQQELSRKSSSWLDIVAPVLVGVGIATSDRDLKLNITTLPYSTYNVIGLDGACWEWNEIAEKTFGLTGEECGVIAQEVETLYPCAVIRGKDGYLLVRYDKLHEIINTRHGKKCPPEC